MGKKMSEVLEFLKYGFAIFFFCVAVSILFSGNRNVNSFQETQKKNILVDNEDVLYQQAKEEIEDEVITRAEIVSILMSQPEYNMQIGDLTITKDTFEKETFDFSLIPEGRYSRTYQFNDAGNVQNVIYKEI